MAATTNDMLLGQLRWRYAVKKFDPARTLATGDWQTLEDSLVLSPSSFGIQPWKFWVVTDPEVKARLPAASWGQSQPADASHTVVFAVRKELGEADLDRYLKRIEEVRGTPFDKQAGFKNVMLGYMRSLTPEQVKEWSIRQVYIALGNLMTAAAVLGIDTCPMEGIDRAKYDEILGIPAAGYETVCACPVGYRAAEDKYSRVPKVRFQNSDVVHHI